MAIRGKIAGLMVTVFVVGMFSPAASAKTCVWTGQGPLHDGELYWTDSGNWDENGVPEDGDTVIFETKSATKHRMNKSLTLAHFEYTSKHAAIFNGKDNQRLTILDTSSKIDCEAAFLWYTPCELPKGAKLTFNCTDGVALKQPAHVFGEGEIVKNGPKSLDIYCPSSDFKGTWTVNAGGSLRSFTERQNVFGTEESEVHAYGSLDFRGSGAAVASKIFLYDATSLDAYQDLILNGDVTFKSVNKATTIYLRGFYNSGYKSTPAAITVNGKLICDNTTHVSTPSFYSYSRTDFRVALNGGFLGWTKTLSTNKKTGCNVIIELNTPFVSTEASIYLYNTDKIVCGAKNVLQDKDVGFYSTSDIDSTDEVFDLNGYDQSIFRLRRSPKDGYKLEGSITSTKGPATLTVGAVYNAVGANRTIESLDGEVSLVLNKGKANVAGDVLFKGGTTTGWIISDWAGCDLSQASFPNLSGIGLKGAGIAYVGATTALKEGVKLDFSGRTTGYLRVETGTDIKAAQVVDGGVDVPAGVYCRVGAGIGGATEVAWLGGDGYNGTVTVAAHAASAIWTGAANDGDLTNGNNWGSGTAPDLSDADMTVDFRYATAANPILLNGTVNLSAAMTCGDINQGRPTFGGTGTLVLGGSGVLTNTMAFVDQASLTWNGSGTLVLKDGASTSTGTLAVKAGKVVLSGDADWTGEVALRGQLELAGKPAYQVQALYLGGSLARYNKPYGASASLAAIKDDVHFAGAGTILSMTKTGLMLLVR